MRYALSLILLVCSPLAAAEFWISPSGSHRGPGTLSDPWSLSAALAQPSQVAPGDTLWLLPGVYNLQQPLVSRLSGTRNRPIKLRAQPGASVTLDCATPSALAGDATCLLIEGSHAWYEGFEILNSREIRSVATPGAPANPRGTGIQARSGPGVKLINLVIHDVGLAIFESQPSRIEIYGLIAYNNGWDGPDRSHGPGIYSRNKTAWARKFIADSIVFQNYRQGLQGYGTGPNVFSQMQLTGNIFFNNGIGRDGLHRNLMFGNESGAHVG
ncbi:MAG: right-handed parallel beta-helix repeat-containing protein, partial [Acidobacteria bacterium]|nr:right-handed parallel beta-helix repeat-containing protein [Acidobacteriota bacterium]